MSLRHELARALRALADRLEAEAPAPRVGYFYVQVSSMSVPSVVSPMVPGPYSPLPWQSPFYCRSTAGAT